MKISRFKKIMAMVITVFVTLGSVTACTKSISSSTTSNKKIKIGVSDYPAWGAWYIAQGENYFKKNGVDVELVWFPVYSDSLQAFNSGKLDMLCVALSDTVSPYLKGVDFKVVLVNDNSAGADGLAAKSGNCSVKSLKGKTVATEIGTIEHFFLLKALTANGMTEKDINLVNMTVGDAGSALIAGTIDAACIWEPSLGLALQKNNNKLLYSSKETPGLIPNLLVASGNLIKNRPKEVEGVVTSFFDSLDFYAANTDKALEYMAKPSNISKEVMRKEMTGSKLFSIDDNIKAMTEKSQSYSYMPYTALETAKFLESVKMIDKAPDTMETFEKMIDPTFVKNIANKRKSVPAPDTSAK